MLLSDFIHTYNLRSKYSQYIISLGTLLTIKFKNENITRSLSFFLNIFN